MCIKDLRNLLIDSLLAMYDYSFKITMLPQSLREANISLILKKGKDPEDCGSYRPISLLNVDLKLLSKILALQLEKILPFIIDEDQTGFIRSRNSNTNIRRLLNIIELSHKRNTDTLIFSLHAEKAFDRVEWPYLFYSPERIGLGDNFIRWVNLLYSSLLAAVVTNWSVNFPLF